MEAAVTPAIERAQFTGGVRNDRRNFEQAHWCLAFPAVPADHPSAPALGLFVQALGGGTSSRLFQELREERGLAYSVYSWTQAFADTGLVGIGCAAERRQAAESVELARQILTDLATGLTQEELDRSRAQVEAGLLMGLETPQGRSDQMARSIEVFGRILSHDELLEQIRSVDLANARAAGVELLQGPVAVASVGAKLALAA
jgi:predicted Zn-dependent peptidase